MGAVVSIALSTPLLFGVWTIYMVKSNRISVGAAVVVFVFGVSMAGSAIGGTALVAGNTGTKVIGDGINGVNQNLGSGGGSPSKPPVAEKSAEAPTGDK
jgi:hypothetical protein